MSREEVQRRVSYPRQLRTLMPQRDQSWAGEEERRRHERHGFVFYSFPLVMEYEAVRRSWNSRRHLNVAQSIKPIVSIYQAFTILVSEDEENRHQPRSKTQEARDCMKDDQVLVLDFATI